MKVKAVFISLFVLLFLSANSFSQKPSTTPLTAPILQNGDEDFNSADFYKVGEITGNIGGAKAILLPKPAYSEAARDAGAEGKVRVEIEIGEEGAVNSAKAVSGNPLLYEDAQKAALNAKFSAPKINGEKTKVSGFLTYNFSIEPPNWFKIGYDLVLTAKSPLLGYLPIPVIKKAFKPEWETENALIDKLQEIKTAEKIAFPNNKPTLITEKTDGGSFSSIQSRILLPSPQNNQQKIEISENLLQALHIRLANDQANLWKFNLGIAFIESRVILRNPNNGREASEILKPFLKNIPEGVSAEYAENLGNLIKLLEVKAENNFRLEVAKTIGKLQRIKN
ncbi:MAG TPA: energy transducer TonB [Pyrinomonadaceae bacterium]|nr:energy transducer TonB [Pyrinomonadaceae bacterium]